MYCELNSKFRHSRLFSNSNKMVVESLTVTVIAFVIAFGCAHRV